MLQQTKLYFAFVMHELEQQRHRLLEQHEVLQKRHLLIQERLEELESRKRHDIIVEEILQPLKLLD